MDSILFDSSEKVTLIGAAAQPRGLLDMALERAPRLVAADGGADRALEAGRAPEAVIGDLDSATSVDHWRAQGIAVHRIAEQETTDLEKCLYSLRAPLILGCGFLGERTDHALAAMSALVAYRARPVILLGEQDLVFHCPERLVLDLPEGLPVSFFPLAPVTGLHSSGLVWGVAGLGLAPGGRIGTSNRAAGGRVEAGFDGPGVLVILPLQALDAAIAALSIPAG
ncbi:thiamine diphosphokinase [Halovulum dunhuangense]|uniref:Thiamine diphosphokinase n=1 Tax=Halovulum dunhuangense TaxID=1505036 RepID=A0A849L1Z3_9RHOB|nr:thiamine diphosphokinase [Halovulum dunhuangense]NNU80251.1 thiamine diphosphokinase [Halovulum dunhuangense]